MFNGSLSIPAAADMHVHVRDGPMLELVAPTIRRGGVDTVFVMLVLAIISLISDFLVSFVPPGGQCTHKSQAKSCPPSHDS